MWIWGDINICSMVSFPGQSEVGCTSFPEMLAWANAPTVPFQTGRVERSSSDNAHELLLLLCCHHKMPGNQSSPKFQVPDRPIHFLFVDTVWLVFYQCIHCAGSPGVGCFIFFWQSVLHSFPHVRAWQNAGCREMAIRSLCGLALLGDLSLGH